MPVRPCTDMHFTFHANCFLVCMTDTGKFVEMLISSIYVLFDLVTSAELIQSGLYTILLSQLIDNTCAMSFPWTLLGRGENINARNGVI